MFVGSGVGINYDGGMHYDLRSIAEATTMEPNEADEALAAVRRAIVDDKRRDRDLWLRGLTVLPATSEDLYQPRDPDRLMGQVMEAIERTADRDLSLQRSVLTRQPFVRERQRLVWSLLPGERGGASHNSSSGSSNALRGTSRAASSRCDKEWELGWDGAMAPSSKIGHISVHKARI